jgi:enoyl-CoA hydratase/carnithine racemase
MAPGDGVLFEVRDGVGIVSLNRPERHNALDDATSARLAEVLRRAMADDEVRCILLRGEGRSFCSGRDTSQLGQRTAGESDLAFVGRAQQLRREVLASPTPVVAAIRGYALGGGFEMALSADVRIAADDARFALPEIGFGLVPDTGGTQLLTALAGPSRAKYLVLSGEQIDAATALSWGVVDFVVAPEELDERALAVAARLAAAPPTAAALGKRLVDGAWEATIRRGMEAELLAQVALFAGEEHRAAKAARLEQLRARRAGA